MLEFLRFRIEAWFDYTNGLRIQDAQLGELSVGVFADFVAARAIFLDSGDDARCRNPGIDFTPTCSADIVDAFDENGIYELIYLKKGQLLVAHFVAPDELRAELRLSNAL